jgi:hypothetical protein
MIPISADKGKYGKDLSRRLNPIFQRLITPYVANQPDIKANIIA